MSLKERQERQKQNTDGVKKISDVSVCLVRVHACVCCCGGGGCVCV